MTSSSDPRLSVAARDSAGAGAVSSASASARSARQMALDLRQACRK